MNIKSLLLGSAAAAVAFSGAQAADAIVIAEPEPMEYVRICDAYGTGFFYIPGTETCLRISGWVRYEINEAEDQGAWDKRSRVQVNLDARSETEWGMLRGWINLETSANRGNSFGTELERKTSGYNPNNTTDFDIHVNRAIIQLGGLWMGYADSLYTSSSNQLGSGLGNTAGYTFADTFFYHYRQTQQIGYQFTSPNGFYAAVAVENDSDDYDAITDTRGDDNHMPDITGKVAYSTGWGGVWGVVGYDESADAVAVRAGVEGRFGQFTARLDGHYQSDVGSVYGTGSEWAVQVTGLYQINPQLGLAGGVTYRGDLDDGGVDFTDADAWQGQIGVNWEPVQNFRVGADVLYTDSDLEDDGSWSGRLRFQRSF